MRNLLLLAAVISLLFVYAGCSSSSKLPTQPASPDLPQVDYSNPETNVLYSGTLEIDVETQTITQTDRHSDTVYDITWLMPDKCPGGCFRFAIVGMVGSVLEIELTLENPLAIQAYDLRIEYLNLYGKVVLNPDSYTDFLGSQIWNIYPFTAFAKEIPDRAFPMGPGGIDTETLFLDCPPGSGAYVNYAITAHLPGMTPEPYEIGDMTQTGELTPDGGSATIRCRVDDHQDDVSSVHLDAIPFTGAAVEMIPDVTAPGYYEVEISNTEGASAGEYTQLIMAQSPNPQNISTYNYVVISVTESGLDEVIVFYSAAVGQRQIFSIDPEGLTAPEQWTTEPAGYIECPKLSPCGAYIMYTRGFSSGYNGDIMMIDVATGISTEITPPSMEGMYGDFSHDGTRIVAAMGFTIFDPLNLWTFDYDGVNPEQLTFSEDVWGPEYNFDDSSIYYGGFMDGVVYIYDVDSGYISIYADEEGNGSPNGNHDGTQIAWSTSHGGEGYRVYVSPTDSWWPTDYILDFDYYIRAPCFSPDGSKIVVDHGAYEGSELAVYDFATETWADITGNAWEDNQPDWGVIIPH